MGASYRTTWSALAAAVPIIVYFVIEKLIGYDLPSEVEGAVGTIVGAAILALGTYARDNRVTSEDAGLKKQVVGEVGAGSTIKLAEPVEVVEAEPAKSQDPSL
jgi:hypothetical protein